MATITTGNVPKALAGGRVKPRPAKVRGALGLAKPFAGADHNDGGCAYHNGGKMAHPCSAR